MKAITQTVPVTAKAAEGVNSGIDGDGEAVGDGLSVVEGDGKDSGV